MKIEVKHWNNRRDIHEIRLNDTTVATLTTEEIEKLYDKIGTYRFEYKGLQTSRLS